MLHICNHPAPMGTRPVMACGRSFRVSIVRTPGAPADVRDLYAELCPACLIAADGVPPAGAPGVWWFDDGIDAPDFRGLDCVPHARITDPATSHEHAEGERRDVDPLRLHRAVWRFLYYLPELPLTHPEIATLLRGPYGPRGARGGLPPAASVRGACADLFRNGVIRPGGRTEPPGHRFYRWHLTPPDEIQATRQYWLVRHCDLAPARIAAWQQLLARFRQEVAQLYANGSYPWVNPYANRAHPNDEEGDAPGDLDNLDEPDEPDAE